MLSTKKLLSLVSFVNVLYNVFGYSTGPPSGICLTPYPHHSMNGVVIIPQSNNQIPYSISLNSNTYSNGSLINITIVSTGIETFKGLLITFKKNTPEIVLPVGEFKSCDSTGLKFLDIQSNNKSCLVHSNSVYKPRIVTCSYQAPFDNQGPLLMSALILKAYTTFWIRLEQTLTYNGINPLITIKNPTTLLTEAISDIECGSTKSCLFFPNFCMSTKNCEYIVSYKKTDKNVDFDIMGSGNGYLALGLSYDRFMGNDLVIACVQDPVSKSSFVQTGYTGGSGKTSFFGNSVDDNIINRKATTMQTLNGNYVMACKFSIPNIITYPNSVPWPTVLDKTLYIMLVNGPLYQGTPFVAKHTESPLLLIATTVLYSDTIRPHQYFSGLEYNKQVHGTLMTVAFIVLLPVAVMIARHFRHLAKKNIHGKQFWFYLHIIFNICFFILAFAGYFFIISKETNNWNMDATVHGSVGTVVMILALINIIMGFARPDIGTSTRIYFYWAHFLNGTLIRLLAFATFWLVFFTLTLRTAFKNWMMTVVIIWTGGEIIFSIVFGILRFVEDKRLTKNYEFNTSKDIQAAQTNHVATTGFVFYILFVITIALALLCGVWLN